MNYTKLYIYDNSYYCFYETVLWNCLHTCKLNSTVFLFISFEYNPFRNVPPETASRRQMEIIVMGSPTHNNIIYNTDIQWFISLRK